MKNDGTSSPKILVIPYTHTLSHLSRPLELSKGLREIGYEVIFAGASSKTGFIEKEGFKVVPLFEPDPGILFKNIRDHKIRFVSYNIIERMIESELSIYDELQPCLVLTDGRFTAPISTQMAGLKHVAIVNASSTEYRSIPYVPFFDRLPFLNKTEFIAEILNRFNLKIEMTFFDISMGIFKELSSKNNLKKNVTATNCLAGVDLTLLADIPEYFPTKKLPPYYHYIGPITWKQNFETLQPSWWPLEKKGKKLVYITMGTTGESDLFAIIYDLFLSSDMISVITTGEQTKSMASIPGKIYIEDYLDGDMIMEQCDLVICHGGNGTIYQALSHGKPVIGIPTIPDQAFNMRRVESLGVGEALSIQQIIKNPDTLLNTVKEMIDNPLYLNPLNHVRTIIKKYDAKKSGVAHIQHLIEG